MHVNHSRKDAEKLLAIAEANDPEAAAEDAAKRNREHQAKHRAKRAAYVSGKPTDDDHDDRDDHNDRDEQHEDDLGFPGEPDEVDGPWHVAWIRRHKTTGPHWGLMADKPAGKPTPSEDYPGWYEQEQHHTKFPTHAEALARCADLQAKETDERVSFIPISQWKLDATSRTCGIRPWTTRE
jgi:hypothetical protein